MAWPCRGGLWADEAATEREYADVANAIACFEPVRMLAPSHKLAATRALLSQSVEVIEMPIDDSWARDSGPNFLLNNKGELAGSCWRFNAWGGKYHPFDQDAEMGSRILELAGACKFSSELVAEGGGITVDGEGTVITTESCFLNANRNPGWSRAEVEAELCRTLGARKVIWLPGDPEETETDGHVDGIAAFIVSGYGYDRDQAAVETWKRLFPDREIVQVRIDHVALGGGGVHCITQQQPAPPEVIF